jgi:hypothetical protein
VLSCTAILLAATAKGGLSHGGSDVNDNDNDDAHGNSNSDDDRNAVAAATILPDFWWRTLDISTEDIMNAMDAMREGCASKGLKKACEMRCF